MKILKTFKKLYFVASLAFFVAMPTFAAELSFSVQNKNISVNQQFQIDLNINTEKENINAVEGKIVFDTTIIELSEIRSGDSVVNFWVDKPIYKDGEIVFSGITPGGFVLDKGLVLSFIFNAKKEGDARIGLENVSALKNDGKGTGSKVKVPKLNLQILKEDKTQKNTTIFLLDEESPDTFKPEVAQDQNLLDNKWFVVFVAQDKSSGIDKYEVKESKYRLFNFAKWTNAVSPHVLKDQSLKSNIYIKAIDKQGNVRVVRLSPKNPISWYANIDIWFIIVLVITVALTLFFFSKKKK